MKLLHILPLFLAVLSLHAQTPEVALPQGVTHTALFTSILQHNKTVLAAKERLRASTVANRADLSLPDPEAEVAYLLGTPSGVPNRTNVSVTQTLDWGILKGERRRWAEAADKTAEMAYLATVRSVIDEALQGVVDVVYYNKVCAELEMREKTAYDILGYCEKKYTAGYLNLMELNKARLNASVSRAELARAKSERTAALAALTGLNGGVAVACNDTLYPVWVSDLSVFNAWRAAAAENNAVRAAQADVAESEAALKVARLGRLPQLTVGFQGEYIKQNNYSGLSVGFTIPLWQGSKQKVKAAEAQIKVRALEIEDVKQQQCSAFDLQYASVRSLVATADSLRADLALTNNDRLLRRSMEEGRISIPDYLLELSFYYTARTTLLEAERDAARAQARLWMLGV